ncbi:unnamed protein product [Symbiodinium sp. CCMP2592]|nr:unnamed protein product [Symbiodinium sp. CCMP2592]
MLNTWRLRHVLVASTILSVFGASDVEVSTSTCSSQDFEACPPRGQGLIQRKAAVRAENIVDDVDVGQECQGQEVEDNAKFNATEDQGLRQGDRGEATTCPESVGEGWRLVRRTASNTFPYTDQLMGTIKYAKKHGDPLGPSFSKSFENEGFDEFLFATGDCSKWMVMKKYEVLSWYSNEDRRIERSHTSSTPYMARMYRRKGQPQDPWITFGNWDQCKALYQGANRNPNCPSGDLGCRHKGLNVFIRTAFGDASTCSDSRVGSGWRLVRRTTAREFPYDDKLVGGYYIPPIHHNPLGPDFHMKFDLASYDEFLFATGDCRLWAKWTKAEMNRWFSQNPSNQGPWTSFGQGWASVFHEGLNIFIRSTSNVDYSTISSGSCESHGMASIHDETTCYAAVRALGYTISRHYVNRGTAVHGCSVRFDIGARTAGRVHVHVEAARSECNADLPGACACRNDPNACICQPDPCKGTEDFSTCMPCPPGSTGTSPASGCTCDSGIGEVKAQTQWPGHSGGCSSTVIQGGLNTALSELLPFKPVLADVYKKEGLLYDLAEKAGEMCTITEADHAAGIAAKKNEMCSMVPKFIIGPYMGSATSDTSLDHFEDMEDAGCKDLPLQSSAKYFLFGIVVPEIIPLGFEGGSLCFAQLMNHNSVVHGTGLLIFEPKLFVGNPVVQNLNVPYPGTGRTITAASAVTSYVSVGVSFPSSGDPQMEMTFSNDFWGCPGECSSMRGHIYAALKLDLTEYVDKKLKKKSKKKLSLGDLSVSFEAKCLIDFDPDRNGLQSVISKVPIVGSFVEGTTENGQQTSGLQSLIDPTEALDFLQEVLQTDVAMGIDGQITITIPLDDWSHGLFRDLDITVGSASILFKKTAQETGLYVTMAQGGFANTGIMDDIQQKILDKFESPAVKTVVGFIGDGIGAVVDKLTSVGVKLQVYLKGQCNFDILAGACSSLEFGLKFTATEFEAYIEKKGGKLAFCFAIKGIFDSCGNGLENVLVLFEKGLEMIVDVVKDVGEFAENAGREVAELSESALKTGKVVVDKIGQGFENGVMKTSQFFSARGEEIIDFAGDAANEAAAWTQKAADEAAKLAAQHVGEALQDTLEWTGQAATAAAEWTGNAAESAGEWVGGAGNDAVEQGGKAIEFAADVFTSLPAPKIFGGFIR